MLLFVVILVCALILILSSTINLIVGLLIGSAALAGLVILLIQARQARRLLERRRKILQARWGIPVRHLSGLPLPIDTPAQLFLTEEALILESGREHWQIACSALHRLMVCNSDLIRRVSDQQLCGWLETASRRVFYALRDKIRHHDSLLARSGLLLLTWRLESDEQITLILAADCRPQQLAELMRQDCLKDKLAIRLYDRIAVLKREAKARRISDSNETVV
jgi:hypothetical protein